MEEQRHTAEPWQVYSVVLDDADATGLETVYIVPEDMHGICKINRKRRDWKANAARIVACVNGCKGVNPDAVADLLEACKGVLVRLQTMSGFEFEHGLACSEITDIKAAILKATGKGSE